MYIHNICYLFFLLAATSTNETGHCSNENNKEHCPHSTPVSKSELSQTTTKTPVLENHLEEAWTSKNLGEPKKKAFWGRNHLKRGYPIRTKKPILLVRNNLVWSQFWSTLKQSQLNDCKLFLNKYKYPTKHLFYLTCWNLIQNSWLSLKKI